MPNKMTTMKAKPKKTKHKVSHMMVRKVNNGYVSEIHHERPPATKDMPYPDAPKPIETAHEDKKSLMDHMDATFPDDGGAGKSEPDGDEAAETE